MKLKSFKIFTVILLILCFFSCEEKEDTAKAIVEIEATAPIISVSEIAETIEVLTTIDISVSDNTENVNTTISINGNNVFTTTQNQFSYDIDPFEFPNGATNLVISAIDEDGNEIDRIHILQIGKDGLLRSENWRANHRCDGDNDHEALSRFHSLFFGSLGIDFVFVKSDAEES